MPKKGYWTDVTFSKKATNVFTEVFKMTDVEKAVVVLSELFDKELIVGYEVGGSQGYNPETGKPNKSPHKIAMDEWNGKIWMDCWLLPLLDKTSPFYESAIKRIPPNNILIVGEFGLLHVPEKKHRDGTTPAYFQLIKSV